MSKTNFRKNDIVKLGNAFLTIVAPVPTTDPDYYKVMVTFSPDAMTLDMMKGGDLPYEAEFDLNSDTNTSGQRPYLIQSGLVING